MRLDGYIRVSRVRGREGPRFISPGDQEERLRAFATAGGHTVVEVHRDLDQPGDRVDRPGLQHAIERVEQGQIDGIVVARLDRFARSAGDAANLVKRIRNAGGELLAAHESIDTSGPFGRFVVQILTAIGELELERIRENWQSARRHAVERGIHLSGRPPLGYERVKEGPQEGVLAPNEVAPLVTELFERRASGEGWARLGTWLEEKGVVTPWGNEHWTVATVRRVVGNRVYLGEARGAGDVVNRGAHPALVSDKLFVQANEARGIAPARSGRSAGLLSGILRCAGCSYALKPASGKTRHGKPFREYRCKPDKAGGRCPAPTSAKAERVESYVLERFFEFIAGVRIVAQSDTPEIGAAREAVTSAESELMAFLDERVADRLGADSEAYLSALEARQLAYDTAQAELSRALAQAPVPSDVWPAEGVDAAEMFVTLELHEQRMLLASVFDAIYLRRPLRDPRSMEGRLFLCWRAQLELELPVRGQRSRIVTFDPPAGSWEPPAEQTGDGAVEAAAS